jgi:hypothetical protein
MEHIVDNQNVQHPEFQNVLSVLYEHQNFINNQDLEGVIGTIHSASPSQPATRKMLGQLFNSYRLTNELIDIKYVGCDEDYIYIRMKQKISKLEGPEFRDNISDSLVAARKESDAWKVWSVMPLAVNYCDNTNTFNSFLL